MSATTTDILTQDAPADDGQDRTRGPDGRFASSTPQAPGDGGSVSPKPDRELSAPGVTTEPTTLSRDEARKLFDRIVGEPRTNGEAQPEAAQPTDDAATPPAAPSTQAVEQPADGNPSLKSAAAPAAAAAELAPYGETLDRKTHDLLKSVGALLPAGEWKALSLYERLDHLNTAREMRNDRNRQYQQQRQGNNQTNTPPARGGNAPAGEFSGQDRQPAGQPAGEVRLPDDVDADLRTMAETLGEDSPVYRASLRMAQRLAAFEQQSRDANERAQASQQDAGFRQFEDAQFARLAKQYQIEATPEDAETIRAAARSYYVAAHRSGRPVEADESVRRAYLTHFNPKIQQRETEQAKRLRTARDSSLAGSVTRGTPTAARPPSGSQSSDPRTRAQAIWDQLSLRQAQSAAV